MAKVAKAKAKATPTDTAQDYLGSKEDSAETRTVATRQRVRTKMEDEIAAFLNDGGKIEAVEPNVMADPPKKPSSNYGSQPI